jgi:hypothetical protein
LNSSDNVSGPWDLVLRAISGTSYPVSSNAQFYRLRVFLDSYNHYQHYQQEREHFSHCFLLCAFCLPIRDEAREFLF